MPAFPHPTLSINSGPLFFGELTAEDTSYASISLASNGFNNLPSTSGSSTFGSSQTFSASLESTTGIRSWMVAIKSFGLVVKIEHVLMVFPSGDFHDSHNPAKANGSPDFSLMRIGVFW